MTDLARFRTHLLDIADTYALLAAKHHAAATGNPGVRVGGSTEPRLPIAVDEVDLTADARRGSLDVADTSPWPEDQIGHLAIATELDKHAGDIAAFIGDPRPIPTVPVLATWLHERAGWAWDYYWDVDRLVIAVDRIARTLHHITNPGKPRAERRTAPCPGCGEATLQGDGERVWCDMTDCGRVLTEAEYTDWATAEAHRTLNGGVGISAKAIAIKYGRPPGTVRYWAHQYAWPKSSGDQRPVLYLASAVEETVAGILERETASVEADGGRTHDAAAG